MGGGVRPQAEAARSTCTWRSACTRRRRISARMAMRCSSTNSRVKPAAMTKSGVSRDGSMVGPPARKMLAGLMQRVPPIHREVDDRHVDEADNGEDGGGAAGAAWLLDRLPERDQPEIEQEQHEHGGEPRVPHPIGAPHRLAPQRAGDEGEETEGGADRGRGLGGDVGKRMAPDERADAGDGDQRIAEHGKPRRRHMHEHDLDGLALLVVWGRHEEGEVEADAEKQEGEPGEPGDEAVGELEKSGRIGKAPHGGWSSSFGGQWQCALIHPSP